MARRLMPALQLATICLELAAVGGADPITARVLDTLSCQQLGLDRQPPQPTQEGQPK